MFDFAKIQPGQWIALETNLKSFNEEDVASPAFVISKEKYENNEVCMLIDQKLNLLILSNESCFKFGTIKGIINSKSFCAKVLQLSLLDNVDMSLNQSVIKKAHEQRKKFLENHPKMEKFFFKPLEENRL